MADGSPEPTITVNGQTLNTGQAMTMRVAMETFAIDLTCARMAKTDTVNAIDQAYLIRIREIRQFMYARRAG